MHTHSTFQNVQIRHGPFRRKRGPSACKGSESSTFPRNSKTLPVILQWRLGRSYAQNLLVPIAAEFLEVYKLKRQARIPINEGPAPYEVLL